MAAINLRPINAGSVAHPHCPTAQRVPGGSCRAGVPSVPTNKSVIEEHDLDSEETEDWLRSLDSVLREDGVDRAKYLIERLIDQMRRSGAHLPYKTTTAYVNTIDTASEDVLGTGTTSLAPVIFYVKFLPRGLFAPGLQYKRSVDEADGRRDTDQILIDLNYLQMGVDKTSWFFTNPQIVIDNETEKEFAIVDLEWGWMMAKWKPDLKGHSFYIRPSFGVGADRLTDYSVEFGYKIVGF